MADEKLSGLPPLDGVIQDTDLIYVVREGEGGESFQTTGANLKASIPAATGDVVGVAPSVAGNFPAYTDTTGKEIEDSGVGASDFDAAGAAAAAQAASVQRANHTGSQAISTVTGLQTALDGKVDENSAITGATKTKVTYDAKGLVTAGADATTADIADSSNKRYVTDAQQTVIGNTSGTNTGDQTNITGNAATVTTNANLTGHITSTGNAAVLGSFTVAQLNAALSDGDVATGGGTASGTNTGDQTSVSGNAGTATALQTARTINGVSFNGTANITIPRTGVVREIWIGAGAMTPTTTNGAATGSYTPAGADVATIDVFAFDDTTAESVQFAIAMPAEWVGTVKVKAYWTSTSGTGNVEFEVAAGAASNDDALGAILGTAVAIVDTLIASDDLHITPASGAITVGGTPALDDLVLFKIVRDTSTASNKTGDALLIGVKLQYTESTTEPSAW